MQERRLDKAKLIEASKQANAKIHAENLSNIKFNNKLKDTVIFLRKELDKFKTERTEDIRAANQAITNAKTENLAKTKEIKIIKESSDKKIKNLNAKIKTLRTVLEKFETKKLRIAEARK